MPLGVARPKACVAWCSVAQRGAALDAGGARRRIDADTVHLRQIEDQPIVAGAQAGAVVPAAADGEEQALLAGEVHRRDHVGDIRRADDQRRGGGRSSPL